MKSPRRDRGGWRHAITVVALLGAITLVLVVFAPLDGVSDHIAAGQAVGAPGTDSSKCGRNSDLDTRLVLQLGTLVRAARRGVRVPLAVADARRVAVGGAMDRLRSRWSVALSNTRARLLGRPVRAAGNSPSVCSIAWKPGHHRSRFQAVISSPGGRRPRVVASPQRSPLAAEDAATPDARARGRARVARRRDRRCRAGAGAVRGLIDGAPVRRAGHHLVALDVGDAVATPAERRVAPRRLPLAMAAVPVLAAAFGGLLLAKAVDAGGAQPGVRCRRPKRSPTMGCACSSRRLGIGRGGNRPGLQPPLGVGSPREQLSAVVERLPATSPTLLPAALVHAEAAAGARPSLYAWRRGSVAGAIASYTPTAR